MTTDWALIREVMNAVIDACEATERLELPETDRALPTGSGANVFDVLTSAWTYPENLRYAVIRARHDLAEDAPYRSELTRALTQAAEACGELVGATRLQQPSNAVGARDGIAAGMRALSIWYRTQMVPQLTQAATTRALSG